MKGHTQPEEMSAQAPAVTISERRVGGTIRVLQGLIVAALVVPGLLFAIGAWYDHTTTVRRAEQDAVRILALIREQAGNLFSGHDIILDLIADRVRSKDWDAIERSHNFLHDLEAIDRRLDDASAILLVDASGRTRATTLATAASGPPPLADRDCFVALHKGDVNTCVSQPYFDASAGQHFFSLCRRLVRDGRFDGIAQVAISADYIIALWASAMPRSTDLISMFRADGSVLAQSANPSRAPATFLELSSRLLNAVADANAGVIPAMPSADGIERITVFSRLVEYPVYVSLGLDKAAVLQSWYSDMLVFGIVTLLSTVGIVAALRLALARARHESNAVALWRAEVAEREKAQAQLHQSHKMESMGKLTGGIAHDFNNLLTVIIGNVAMANRTIVEDRPKRLLGTALKAGESAVALTQRLLAFARKQVLQPTAVNLLDLVQGMRSLLARTLGPDIRLDIEASHDPWLALADANQMEVVVLNLAINARDAMPSGGRLLIAVDNRETGPDTPRDLAPGEYVVLTASDSGIGMDEDTLARATEPFFTTKEPGKGTGLGLSMMQGVVTQSGGAARITSAPKQGTTVELWLPRTQLPVHETKAAIETALLRSDGKRILVCDDNQAVLSFICDALRDMDYQVIGVEDGRAALAALDTRVPIDLLIVDFTMPGMNGVAVARAVRGQHPALPILLVTGNADPEAIEAQLPDVPVLRKPFDQRQLLERVADILARPIAEASAG
jgi:signal transduction histidine kinase